jgi:hypothetical protein
MSVKLTIYDETLSGEKTPRLKLDFAVQCITVRDLIRDRVYQEVRDYNQSQPKYFRGLVQPTDSEQFLNGYKLLKQRSIDWEKQYEKALQAFQNNGFIILVNDRQVEDLEEEIELMEELPISFLRLIPLVGG